MNHRHAHPRRWWLRAVLMANVLLYLCYFLHLQADFPNGSPWNDFSKYTDEGWYGGAAVHLQQTGHWYIAGGFNPAVGLPMWPLLLAGWFHLTGGAGMVAARALTVVLFGGSLVLLYLLLRRITGQLVAALAVTLVVVNPYCFSFNRLAILEPLVVFLICSRCGLGRFGRMPRRTRCAQPRSVFVGGGGPVENHRRDAGAGAAIPTVGDCVRAHSEHNWSTPCASA